MIELERSVEVARSAEDAFAFLAQPERFPEWLPGLRSVEPTSAGPLGLGSTYRVIVEGPGGVTIEANGRVVTYEPPVSVAIEARSTMLALAGAYRVEPISAQRCAVRARMTLEPLGFLRFLEARIRSELEAELPAALARLAAAIETDPSG